MRRAFAIIFIVVKSGEFARVFVGDLN
jgi:hypothetical protein